MSVNIRSLTQHTMIYGVGYIATRLVTFLLLPLYTNQLSQAEYGLVALVFAFLAFMNHIYNYGMDSALMRFYGNADGQSKKSVLSTAVWMALGTSFVFSVIIYLLYHPIGAVLTDGDYVLIKYAAVILYLDCIVRVPFALLRLQGRPVRFIAVRMLNVLLTVALNIYFLTVLKMGVIGVFRATLIASAFTAVAIYILSYREIKFTFSGSIAKDLILFGLPFIPMGLAVAAMEMLNRKIIELMLNREAVGIFSAYFKLGIFIQLVSTAFYYAWQPFFMQAGKKESSKAIFSRVLTYFTLVTLSCWVVISLFIHEIVAFRIGSIHLVGEAFWGYELLVPLFLLAYVFYGMNLVFLPGIYFEKKTRYLATITVFASLINVVLNFLLIPLLGLYGSALASVCGYLVLAVVTHFVSQKLFHVPYEYGRVLLVFAIAIAAVVPIYLTDLSFMTRIAIAITFPILLRLLGFFKKEEIAAIRVLLPWKRK